MLACLRIPIKVGRLVGRRAHKINPSDYCMQLNPEKTYIGKKAGCHSCMIAILLILAIEASIDMLFWTFCLLTFLQRLTSRDAWGCVRQFRHEAWGIGA